MVTDAAVAYNAFDSDYHKPLGLLQWIAQALCLPAHVHVLDVGCGTGRLFPGFAESGWTAEGLEPNASFRSAARNVGSRFGFPVDDGGFNDVTGEAVYDLIVGVNSSFAHVLTPTLRLDAFERCSRALAPGGALFLDLPNFLWILTHYRKPAEMRAEPNGVEVRLVRGHDIDPRTAVFTTREEYTIHRPDGSEDSTVAMTHAYAMTTYPELAFQLGEAGFVAPKTVASYESRQFDETAGARLMIVAQKPTAPAPGGSEPSSA